MRSFSSNACDVLLDSEALERCYFHTKADAIISSSRHGQWSEPLDWVFVVLFICVRGSPFSHFHILRCYFHIATPLWCDTKAAAIRRLGQSHLIGSLLYFSSVLEVSHQVLEMFYLMFKCLLLDYSHTNADYVSPT